MKTRLWLKLNKSKRSSGRSRTHFHSPKTQTIGKFPRAGTVAKLIFSRGRHVFGETEEIEIGYQTVCLGLKVGGLFSIVRPRESEATDLSSFVRVIQG